MKTADRKIVEQLREKYPKGTVVELVRMDDPQAPNPGTRGTVIHVDDAGTIHVQWDTGSSLGAVYGIDEILPVCPVCHKSYSLHPALSRADGETMICPDCGLREAMDAVGFKKEFQDEVIAETKKKQPAKIKFRFEDLPKHDQARLLRAIDHDIRKWMKEKENKTPENSHKK